MNSHNFFHHRFLHYFISFRFGEFPFDLRSVIDNIQINFNCFLKRKAKAINLKLLDDYSGPVLALWRGSPYEVAADMMACCFVGSRSLWCVIGFWLLIYPKQSWILKGILNFWKLDYYYSDNYFSLKLEMTLKSTT